MKRENYTVENSLELMELLPIPLLSWYREQAREMPWRVPPESAEMADPYGVWVSEIMLQQTRVAAVIGYYQRFMEALPTLKDLAEVEEDKLLKLWEGLGYYNRARNLQKAARQVMMEFGGVFPSTADEILSLAGIGSYTAGAIGSISFGLPVPAVDGNVLRVITRITGDYGDILKANTKKRAEQAIGNIIPIGRAGDFNQSLIELGATVCIPNGAPKCEICPVANHCRANVFGLVDELPVKQPKKPRKVEDREVFLLFHQGKVGLRQRPETGLLAKLWEYPNQLSNSGELESWGISTSSENLVATGRHIFSHIEWHMTVKVIELDSSKLPDGWVWADESQWKSQYAIPSAFSCCQEAVLDRFKR